MVASAADARFVILGSYHAMLDGPNMTIQMERFSTLIDEIAGCSIGELAQEFGTPVFIYHAAKIVASRHPLIKFAWLKKGVHINAIGADAPGKQELDFRILKNSKIIIDDWEQARHSGEINVAIKRKIISKRNIYANIGEVVVGKKKGRVNKNEITVFDSTGLAIQDVAIAQLIYKTALQKRKGFLFELFLGCKD